MMYTDITAAYSGGFASQMDWFLSKVCSCLTLLCILIKRTKWTLAMADWQPWWQHLSIISIIVASAGLVTQKS